MLNLQLDQFVYGLLGLPEQSTLFDADEMALTDSADHLAKLRFTGQELLEVLRDWIEDVQEVSDVPDQGMQINMLSQRLDRLENMVAEQSSPEESEGFEVDDLFDEEYEEQVPPDDTEELSDEYITVDNTVSDEDIEAEEESEETEEEEPVENEEENVEDTGELEEEPKESEGEFSPEDVVSDESVADEELEDEEKETDEEET